LGTLARLEALLDDLAALGVDTLGDGELHQMVVSLSRCDTRLEAALMPWLSDTVKDASTRAPPVANFGC